MVLEVRIGRWCRPAGLLHLSNSTSSQRPLESILRIGSHSSGMVYLLANQSALEAKFERFMREHKKGLHLIGEGLRCYHFTDRLNPSDTRRISFSSL